MTKWLLSVLLLGLIGCAGPIFPVGESSSQWMEFGQTQAQAGEPKQTQTQMSANVSSLTSEQYQSYSEGWDKGQAMYCSQSPQMLAIEERPYMGICDTINPFFREDYNNARQENAF
ncbi:DUF2799 domain-containing protein [Vibrio sp. SM6]|uniref:DUF2799 domain-containing protein n=1 Tax=Vibrio agarilyticus TaxID=2726741 RepID=A0A7X8TQJ5_9VIBR|nr:DUF2799 domain-containing protein [Vibrio agarilyticus]NLS12418.1 DUF2799 domain-containing protein [Vibrio agarilyticus]